MWTKIALITAALLALTCVLVWVVAGRDTYANYQEAACRPQCWFGIVPGQSTREDARRILSNLPFIVPLSIIEDNPSRFGMAFSWLKKWTFDIRDWIELDEKDVVTGVVVHLDGSLHIQDVIQNVGVPEKVELYNIGVERPNVHLTLFYPGQGFVYEFFVPSSNSTGKTPEIRPDLPGILVEYRVPDRSPEHLIFW